ncbi:MAG: hypothetical protein LN412_00625 [Candidatus Thermoplasmatota archaeon]|nr:hypothetical protein [Candidatus Thermoplasmatota archaeon]
MSEERPYPVRTIHDFLSELDREWSRFRTGSLIGFLASVLVLFFILRWIVELLQRLRAAAVHPRLPLNVIPWLDLIFLVGAFIAVVYSAYALFRQYRFFERWERRIGLLQHIEKQLIEEQLGEKG